MRVAIIGRPAKEQHFNASDYDEVWGWNATRFPWAKWTRRFNLHKFSYLEGVWQDGLRIEAAYMARETHVPLYTIDPWPKEIAPNNVIFPREKLQGFFRPNYHCSTFDWLVAFAIQLGARKIGIHGISLWGNDQPLSARACGEYWCGIAEGRGIEIEAKEDSDLFTYMHMVRSRQVYGYDDVQILEKR
jgi:hypothetical protein